MNTIAFRKKIAGIGLIEVLVATVVIAVGLLALASLQGNLASGSRTNKTRAEAKTLADTKNEQLRDNLDKAAYAGIANGSDSVGGVTETFTRSWSITSTAKPDYKQLSVSVCWSDGCPVTLAGANKENQVKVQSVITFDDAGKSAKNIKDAIESGSIVGGPSTNAQSSNDITENINLPTSNTPYEANTKVTVDGKDYIVQDNLTAGYRAYSCADTGLGLAAFENDLYTRRVNHDGVTGDEAIELYEKVTITINGTPTDYCMPRIRYNGGVIIPIRGIVHSGATPKQGSDYLDVNLFTFNASETGAFCVFKPQTGAKSAPYVCYVGGNCQGSSSNTSKASSADVKACPPGYYAAAKVGPGGWRGKVGLLGVAGTSSDYKNVCFAEELAGTPDKLDTARNYFASRNGLNEGVNKPYSCHDFLIIDGQSTRDKVFNECKKQAGLIGGFKLASKTIQRTIDGDNIFDPAIDQSFCVGSTGTAYTIQGTMTGVSATPAPIVTVTDGGTPISCSPVSTGSYTCSITTSATSVTISGVYNSQPVSCNVSLSSTTPSTTGCPLAFTASPIYTITGHISATTPAAANAVSLAVVDGSNTINCVNDQNYNTSGGYNTYTCSISTLSTTGLIISAKAATGYSVAPITYNVPKLSGSTSSVVVPSDFVASVAPTYTISGTIFFGKNVDNLTSPIANLVSGSCTITAPNTGWKQNATGSYTCTVYSGSNALTIAISDTCSNTKSGNTPAYKKYTMSSTGVTSTTGTGQLVIDLGTVNGPQTHNVSVEESTTAC